MADRPRTQVSHDSSYRDGIANGCRSEGFPGWRNHGPTSSLEAPVSQQYVSGDDDGPRVHMLDNPVVCRIKSVIYYHARDEWVARYPDWTVRDNGDVHVISPRDLVDFVLDRTGVSIDQNLRHSRDVASIVPNMKALLKRRLRSANMRSTLYREAAAADGSLSQSAAAC
jgi:hypothetical protein